MVGAEAPRAATEPPASTLDGLAQCGGTSVSAANSSPYRLQDSLGLPQVGGGFRVVAADPPWRFKSNSVARPGRNAMRHYDCMELADIAALAVKDIVARDAALFLWVPGPHLVLGHHIPIMRAWGFQPSGVGFAWVKVTKTGAPCFGGGFTTRKCVEYAVIGKRGRSVRLRADVSELIIAPRREHSRKPDEFFARIERYSRGPYCELFARETRPSWRQWGDQATFFDEVAG
jgi:N6-adenosine-specific RNA methylase IME4